MYFGEDARIVHFLYADSSGRRVSAMKLWSSFLGGDRVQVRPSPSHAGWRIGIVRTPSGMQIIRDEEPFPKKTFDLVPAPESELPDWFEPRLARALARMSAMERESRNAEQDGEPVGFSVTLHNVNEITRSFKKGRLFQF